MKDQEQFILFSVNNMKSHNFLGQLMFHKNESFRTILQIE